LHVDTVEFSTVHKNDTATAFDFADIKIVRSCILEAK